MPATTKFEIFETVPYEAEYIVALSCVGSVSGQLPTTETIMWDICNISVAYDSPSLSGISLQSMGMLKDYGLQTVTETTVVSGYLDYGFINAPQLSSYCTPVFTFMSGPTPILSLTGLSSQGLTVFLNSTQSASGYVYRNSTKYYFISNWGSIDVNGTALCATYIADAGTYNLGTFVNASTANILYISPNSLTHMYRISSVLSTGAITNTAVEIFPDYPLTLRLSSMNFNNYPETRELTLEVTNPLTDTTSRLSGQNVAIRNTVSFLWDYNAPVGGTITPSTTSSYVNNYDITTGTFDAETRCAVLSTYTFDVSAISASNVIFSDTYTILLDEFPDQNSFRFDTIILNNEPSDVNYKIWRLVSNNSVFAQVTADIPGLDPSQGNLGLTWGNGTVLSFAGSPTISTTVQYTYPIYGRVGQNFTSIINTTSGLSAVGGVSIIPFNSGSLVIGVCAVPSGYYYNLWDTTPGILTAAGLPISGTINYGTGNWFIDFFNQGLLISGTSISGAYTITPVLTTYRIASFANEISASNWLSAHSKFSDDYIDLQFVGRFLSATFIAYPEYYFNSTANLITLNNSNYTLSPGVCSYGEGSTIDIYVSASEQELGKNTLYQWSSNNYLITAGVGTKEDVMSFGDDYTHSPEGSAITLSVFDNDFTTDMIGWYYNDENVRVKYPNFQVSTISSDNSNPLFQNVRAVEYDYFVNSVAPITQALGSSSIDIRTSVTLTFPSYSPVEETNGSYIWTLSASNWISTVSVPTTIPILTYKLIQGGGTYPGTIKFGSSVTLIVAVSAAITKIIPVLDFSPSIQTFTSQVSTTVNGDFAPLIRIYTRSLNALENETIYFENITQTTTGAPVSAYLWNMGNNSTIINVSGTNTNLISALYTDSGVYTVTVSSVNNLGVASVQEFSDIITIVPDYPFYNDNVLRLYGSEGIQMPYDFDDIKIKPNEWAIENNINASFKMIHDNMIYLNSISQKYLEPPTQYQGWLGQSLYNETDISWHVLIPNINSQVNSLENIVDNSRGVNNIKDVRIYNNNIYLVTNTTIYVLSSDYNATEIDNRSVKDIGNPFFGIESFGINSQGKIYVLDGMTQEVSVFDNYETNGWKYLFSWGKYGGVTSLEGFKTPVDLFIDSQDNIWITDNGNHVIKKYTENGSWLMTLQHADLKNPISTTVDDQGNIHVLTNTNVMKFKSNTTFLYSYNFRNSSSTPTKIITSQDGFIYVCFNNSITKLNRNGVYAGTFANTFNNVNYKSLYHDQYRRLYVTNTNSILKFFERVTINSVNSDNSSYTWNMNDVYIEKNEYIQDFVYNRSLSRMWDNLDIAKRSVFGSIYQYTDYLKNKRNIIVGLNTTQYNRLLNLQNKQDIFIGVNEIVTADSINRCLLALSDVISLLLDFQTTSQEDNTNITIVEPTTFIYWRWIDVASTGINPFTWNQVSNAGFYATTWRNAKTGAVPD